MTSKRLITGATGILGKAVLRAAASTGLPVRQGVRVLAKADPNFEAVHLNYTDSSTIAPALAGVSAMVLMAPPLDPDAPAQLAPVVAAAKLAGLRHIVLISAFGVNHNEQAPLRIVENLVINGGVPFTILRPNFLMDNFSQGFLAVNVREQNAIYLAAGDGKTSFIAAEDVATVVVAAIQKQFTGKEFDLTGPAALDHSEVAKIIGEAAGRRIEYYSLTEDEMLAGARSHGMREPSVDYLGILYWAVRSGLAAGVSGDFESITGRKPMTFEMFAMRFKPTEAASIGLHM